MSVRLRIGLIINPIAGLGGRVALKGTDSVDIQKQAVALGAKPEAELRTRQSLEILQPLADQIIFETVVGTMGADLLASMGFNYKICHTPADQFHTTEADTIQAASAMQQTVDLLLFSGGDGTARNVLEGAVVNNSVLAFQQAVRFFPQFLL